MRIGGLAAIYGFVAGGAAALVLWLMEAVKTVVWSGPDTRWYVFAVIIAGGSLIAVLRRFNAGEDLATQVAGLRDPLHLHRRAAQVMALGAIVAVGFGGAIGPEAGILAVVSEMSALIGLLLARNAAEARMLSESGIAGALGGLYGSPPAGAVVAQEHPAAPRWQVYVAGVMGLLAFLLIASRVMPGHGLRVDLPAYIRRDDARDMLLSLIPATFGAVAGLAFVMLMPLLKAGFSRLGGVVVQTLAGTVLFAILAAAFPILRFSGHHEIEALMHWGQGAGFAALAALALLKALALALCLASGWRGGAAFPLIFIGAAAGGAALQLFPAMPPTVALIAGIVAALTVGMGKPLAAVLLAALILGVPAVGPLCVGAGIGWAFSRLVPEPELH